jgi:hypothetical protein
MAADIFIKSLDQLRVQKGAEMFGLFSWCFGALYIHGGVLFPVHVVISLVVSVQCSRTTFLI